MAIFFYFARIITPHKFTYFHMKLLLIGVKLAYIGVDRKIGVNTNESLNMILKINRPQIGLFFCSKFYCTSFWYPLYVFYNPIFDFSFVWKFCSDLMQICDFRKNIVSLFESPLGIIFHLEFSLRQFHYSTETLTFNIFQKTIQ